jgi:DNA polymerase-1
VPNRLWSLIEDYYVPASIAFAHIEMNGAKIDIPYLEGVRSELTIQLAADLERLGAMVDDLMGLDQFKDGEFNPNSSHQVKKALYSETGLDLAAPKNTGRYAYKQTGDSTSKDVLKYLAKDVAKEKPHVAHLIEKILQYRVRSKILGTYVNGILQRTDSDGRVRGDLNLHGTATGRTSCSNPNLQNIPDASHVGYDIRRAFIAEEGWTFMEADFSQLELRVAALFSQDPVLLDVYREGGDIHQEVALMLWNKPKEEVTKYERYLAKCMNFGVIYGRGGRSIATGPEMDNLKEQSGRSWSVKEIEDYFNKFKVGYKVLFDWMELVKKDSLKKQYVENPLGFRRRFDCIFESGRGHIERQAVNTPIQGFAGQIMIHAIVLLQERLDPDRARLLFTVHDSVDLEVRDDYIEEAAAIVQDTMENELPQGWVTLPQSPKSPFKEGQRLEYNLPFVADVNVGPNWGDAKHNADEYRPLIIDEEDEVLV